MIANVNEFANAVHACTNRAKACWSEKFVQVKGSIPGGGSSGGCNGGNELDWPEFGSNHRHSIKRQLVLVLVAAAVAVAAVAVLVMSVP
jgi:hypothetical protein